MDKENKTFTIAIYAFMIISLFNIFSMKSKINNLEWEISRIRNSNDSGFRDTGYEISSLRNDLLDRIDKGESMLTSFETDAKYIDGQILYTIHIVPKVKQNDEKVFISIGDDMEEAIYTDSSNYIATFTIEPTLEIKPLVTIESPTGVRQEVLPNTYLDELFGLNYDSIWYNSTSSSDEKGMFSLFLYANNDNSISLLSGEPNATAVILDRTSDIEIDRIKMEMEENNPRENEPKTIKFNVDLSEYINKEGSYEVFLELVTEDGVNYQESIASYTNHKMNSLRSESMSSSMGSGLIYPIWVK